MPRYFFNVTDGRSFVDPNGTELPDVYAAQARAIQTSGDMLRDMAGKFWTGESWKMEVHDQAGRELFTLTFSAQEHLS
ncbi:DUF6894 family protein [uncultured Enterovirga sp.]|uniref:DUF6894 family protein n=1 Tax=uncultured Enterovirga sp. TaxID=2026352 RepID=UPI0035CC7D22